MLLILMFLVLALPLLLLFLLRKNNDQTGLLPPGPPGLPFIGNLHQMDNTAPHLRLCQLSKQYGPLMSLQLGLVPTLVVSSAKMAKEVFKTQDVTFSGKPSLLGQQKMSYNGLDLVFSPYNDYYKEMRKICTLHLFSVKRVQCFRPVREDEVHRMINKISKSKSCGEPINLSETFMDFSSSVICRVAFGKRYEDVGSERCRFYGLLNEAQAVMGSFYVSDYFPVMGWVDRVSGFMRRLEKNFEEMDRFYQEIIDEHVDPKRHKPEQEDIVDVLLRLQKDHSFAIDLTWDHIKGVLMNIFIAGTDTAATTLVWAMTLLIKNPRVMKKVQEEVTSLVGKKGFVSEDDLQSLPYLKAVFKETMRLHPAAPLLVPRETTQQCNIDGYVIKPKTLVFVNAWAIGRDPEAWEHPEEFWPERFLTNSLDFTGQDFELIPFGAGRRVCPGLNLGSIVVELALANLLYFFKWELPPGVNEHDINTDVKPGITMHKKDALCLMATTC